MFGDYASNLMFLPNPTRRELLHMRSGRRIAFPQRGTPPPGESLRHLSEDSADMPLVVFEGCVHVNPMLSVCGSLLDYIPYDCFIAEPANFIDRMYLQQS